jgi:hypothetical protein
VRRWALNSLWLIGFVWEGLSKSYNVGGFRQMPKAPKSPVQLDRYARDARSWRDFAKKDHVAADILFKCGNPFMYLVSYPRTSCIRNVFESCADKRRDDRIQSG